VPAFFALFPIEASLSAGNLPDHPKTPERRMDSNSFASEDRKCQTPIDPKADPFWEIAIRQVFNPCCTHSIELEQASLRVKAKGSLFDQPL
jgi:hypothetical protein